MNCRAVPCCAVFCQYMLTHFTYFNYHQPNLYACRGGGDSSSLPTRFAWLVGNLLLHGHLLLQQLAGDSSVGDGAEYVGDMRQLQLGPSNSSPEDEPVALVGWCDVRLAGG